jgi:hypothetical protein
VLVVIWFWQRLPYVPGLSSQEKKNVFDFMQKLQLHLKPQFLLLKAQRNKRNKRKCRKNVLVFFFFNHTIIEYKSILPGDQEGLFKLAVELRKFFNSVIYNTATGYVLLVYLTNI